MIVTSLHGSPTGLNLFLMAFNWQTFKTRTLTAAVFVVVMLAGLLINRWTFFILFSDDTFWLLVGISEVDENNLC